MLRPLEILKSAFDRAPLHDQFAELIPDRIVVLAQSFDTRRHIRHLVSLPM
jgi:hypothetical protein